MAIAREDFPLEWLEDFNKVFQYNPNEIPAGERRTVTLTGSMAVWRYLVVFHAVVHKFTTVVYDDGRNIPVTVAKHG